MSPTVCMVSTFVFPAWGARICTVPPTLVCTAISRYARPLLRMSRYATVFPGVVGVGTYALVTLIADDVAWWLVAHPLTPSAASRTPPAMPRTDVTLRLPIRLPRLLLGRSPEPTPRAEQGPGLLR